MITYLSQVSIPHALHFRGGAQRCFQVESFKYREV